LPKVSLTWCGSNPSPDLESRGTFTLLIDRPYLSSTSRKNKRARKALGRLPEEKVKGHSGANNREPQGHNLKNFGKGPFNDVIY